VQEIVWWDYNSHLFWSTEKTRVVLFFETHKRQAEGREESSRKRGELEKERRDTEG